MIVLFVVAYLLFSLSGWWAVLRFFITPSYCGDGCWTDGLDITYTEAIVFALMALVPLVGQVACNTFWISTLGRMFLRHWPEGSVFIKGKSYKEAL